MPVAAPRGWFDRSILRDSAPRGGPAVETDQPCQRIVFDLIHVSLPEEGDESAVLDVRGIGLYSTREAAEAAIAAVRDAPGFRDWPGGFRVLEVVLDRTGWTGGFVRDHEGADG